MKRKKFLVVTALVMATTALSSCSMHSSATPLKHKVLASNSTNFMAIKENGTILHTPIVYAPGTGESEEKLDWENIIEIACGGHIDGNNWGLGLKDDGTVVGWGYTIEDSESGIDDWENVISIASSPNSALGLKENGTVCGMPSDVNEYVSDWEDIIAVALNNGCYIGLKSDGTLEISGPLFKSSSTVRSGDLIYEDLGFDYFDALAWTDIIAIDTGYGHLVGLKNDGTVVAIGNNYYGQCDVSDWTDITAIHAGAYNTVGIRQDGTVVAVGNNEFDQCDVSEWSNIISVEIDELRIVGLQNNGKLVISGMDFYDEDDEDYPKNSLTRFKKIRTRDYTD